MTDLEQRLAKLQKQFHGLRIMGGEGVIVHGSPSRGYAVELRPSTADSGIGGGGDIPGCTDPTALNFNPSATVDDGSCTYNCPELALVCDSINATLNKCGVISYFSDNTASFTPNGVDWYDTLTLNCNEDPPLIYSGGPTSTPRYFDTSTASLGGCYGNTGSLDYVQHVDCATGCYSESGSCVPGTTFTCVDDGACKQGGHDSDLCPPSCHINWGSLGFLSGTVVLSSEYTTSQLISDTEDALPAYPGTFDGSCSATRELAADESSYSISRFRYKFTFPAIGHGFTITWNEHTLFDDMTTSDNPLSTSVSAGATETSVFECLEPSANGTTTITDIVCTIP